MAKVSTFNTKVVGVSYYQSVIRECYEGQPVDLVRNPTNEYDENAIEVNVRGSRIGHLSGDEAEGLAPFMDERGAWWPLTSTSFGAAPPANLLQESF